MSYNGLFFIKKSRKYDIINYSQNTIEDIPDKAYEYVINGKFSIEWNLNRYHVKTDKKSKITNDSNDWSEEIENPIYIYIYIYIIEY